MTKSIEELKSPTRKIISFLKKGRDDLRLKYSALMERQRTTENHVRSLVKRRDNWRQRAELAEAELKLLKKSQNNLNP